MLLTKCGDFFVILSPETLLLLFYDTLCNTIIYIIIFLKKEITYLTAFLGFGLVFFFLNEIITLDRSSSLI